MGGQRPPVVVVGRVAHVPTARHDQRALKKRGVSRGANGLPYVGADAPLQVGLGVERVELPHAVVLAVRRKESERHRRHLSWVRRDQVLSIPAFDHRGLNYCANAPLLPRCVVSILAVAVHNLAAARTLQRQRDVTAASEEHHRRLQGWQNLFSCDVHRRMTDAQGHEDRPGGGHTDTGEQGKGGRGGHLKAHWL